MKPQMGYDTMDYNGERWPMDLEDWFIWHAAIQRFMLRSIPNLKSFATEDDQNFMNSWENWRIWYLPMIDFLFDYNSINGLFVMYFNG